MFRRRYLNKQEMDLTASILPQFSRGWEKVLKSAAGTIVYRSFRDKTAQKFNFYWIAEQCTFLLHLCRC